MQEKPGQPGYTVETTRGNIDLQRKGWKHLDERADLHVVAVVKANSDHMENMVCKEGQKNSDNGEPDRDGTGDRYAEVEG